jgi:hypothetical protein
VNDRFLAGELCEADAYAEIQRRLSSIVAGARRDLGVAASNSDDDIQALHLRIATMDAASRYDPTQSTSPQTYLRGISRILIREQLFRRRPTEDQPWQVESAAVEGDQLARCVREAQLAELEQWLALLSPGEIRALVNEFGPVLERSCSIGRRRRLRDPVALPRAIEALRALAAHQYRQ